VAPKIRAPYPSPFFPENAAEISVEKITRGIVEDVRFYGGEREQNDDMPVTTIRWRGLKESTF
jgi:hypothetical protein